MIKVASNPSLDGLRQQLAKYWFTDRDKITIKGDQVYQDGKLMRTYVANAPKGVAAYPVVAR